MPDLTAKGKGGLSTRGQTFGLCNIKGLPPMLLRIVNFCAVCLALPALWADLGLSPIVNAELPNLY